MNSSTFTVRVSAIVQVAPAIKQFELTPCDGALPAFTGGAHITVSMMPELRRSYSLISNPVDQSHYQIAVMLESESRGGSRYMHEQVKEGDELEISAPDNYFPIDTTHTGKHLLVAGGIGITPFLSYLPTAEALKLDFELHYCVRDQKQAAFIEALQQRLGDRLYLYDATYQQRLNVKALIKQHQSNAHVYACGPTGLINDVVEQGNALLGQERTHFENFGEVDNNGNAFEVHFQRSGFSLPIGPDSSILQAIEADGRLQVECLCRNGVCGTCEADILEGEADHRDSYLEDDEKAEQSTMMICVSRAKTSKLVLDL